MVVIKLRNDAGLVPVFASQLGVFRELRRVGNLDRYVTPEVFVECSIHHSAAASTEHLSNREPPDRLERRIERGR